MIAPATATATQPRISQRHSLTIRSKLARLMSGTPDCGGAGFHCGSDSSPYPRGTTGQTGCPPAGWTSFLLIQILIPRHGSSQFRINNDFKQAKERYGLNAGSDLINARSATTITRREDGGPEMHCGFRATRCAHSAPSIWRKTQPSWGCCRVHATASAIAAQGGSGVDWEHPRRFTAPSTVTFRR